MTAQAFGIETSHHFESSLKSNISLLGVSLLHQCISSCF